MKLPKWLLRVGQIALIAAASYGIARALAPDLGRISAHDLAQWRPRISTLLLATALLVALYLFHFVLWRRILAVLGGVKPGLKSALRVYFVSSLGRYIPGKFWQIAGLVVLAQQAGLSAVAATAASLVGQFGVLTTGLFYLALLLPGWGGRAPIAGAVVLIVLGAGSFFVFTATRVGHAARAALTRRFGQRFGNALMLLDRIRWHDAVLWFVAYAASWALFGMAFVAFVGAFVPLAATSHLHIAGIIAAAYLFGYVALFAPAGLGIREAVMLGLLTQVMPASAALVVSVASRVWLTLGELLPLALVPVVRDRANRTASDVEKD